MGRESVTHTAATIRTSWSPWWTLLELRGTWGTSARLRRSTAQRECDDRSPFWRLRCGSTSTEMQKRKAAKKTAALIAGEDRCRTDR